MRPPMLIGLALALALTAWMALQGDEGEVEVVTRRGAQDRGAQDRSSPRAGAATPGRRAASSAAASQRMDTGQAQLLVRSVAQWQARPALPPLTADQARPWASQMPPPPPPRGAADAAPPPPVAPPFPHAWVGRFDDETRRAIVAGEASTWVVAVGDVIEGQWRIDQIQDKQLSMTYLPLQQHQTVAMKAP